MAVGNSDIIYRYSEPDASAGDDSAQADANDSTGGWLSTTDVPLGSPLNSLFPDVTSSEASDGITRYRCVFAANTHAADTLFSAMLWLDDEVADGGDIAVGLDPEGVVDMDASSQQAETIADEETAPSGVSFSSPTTKASGISIGDIGPEQAVGVWVRLTVAAATASLASDGVDIRVEGDTIPEA